MQSINTKPLEGVFRTLEDTRRILSEMLKKNPQELLLTIPKGSSNNIIWNVCHIISVQQSLTYYLSKQRLSIDKSILKKYARGTFPSLDESPEFISEVSDFIIESILELEFDYNDGLFSGYTSFKTLSGTELKTIEDGLIFNAYHEGLHMGTILSIRKQLKQSS